MIILGYGFLFRRSTLPRRFQRGPATYVLMENLGKLSKKNHKTNRLHIYSLIRGVFEMNCLFLSEDFKFQVSPKVLISCPRSTPRG